jgi:hypothetical protein
MIKIAILCLLLVVGSYAGTTACNADVDDESVNASDIMCSGTK